MPRHDRVRIGAAVADATADASQRTCQYRKAFRWAAVSYPFDVLSLDAPWVWIRRHGVAVDVGDADELDTALSTGIDPLRVIMHQSGPQGRRSATWSMPAWAASW